jgi:hypothetical protein
MNPLQTPPLLFLPAWFIALFVLFVTVAITLAIMTHLKEKKRAETLQEHAQANGWDYLSRDRDDRPRRYRGFTPFGQGHTRYAFNVMTGEHEGTHFELFDYHYAITKNSGKNTSTTHYYHKICTLTMPIPSPGLTIQREHIGHKILGAVGAGDINFESDEFSRRYWVKSKDRRFAYDVIDARTMEFLLDNPGWHWQWNGNTLLLHKQGKLGPHKASKMLRTAHRFKELLPRHLLAENMATTRDTATESPPQADRSQGLTFPGRT